MKILAIDPNKTFHYLFQTRASLFGADVDCYANSQDALSVLSEQHYDLIVLARYQERGDYRPLLKHIRSIPRFNYTPVLLLASEYDFEFVKEAISESVTDVISRSRPDDLIDGIKRSLRKTDYCFDAAVLLVEDSNSSGLLVKAILEQYGMRVDWCKSVKEAEQAINSSGYDLVLLDLLLDENHSGLELLHCIRHHPDQNLKEIPVLAMTGFNDPSRRLLTFHLGVDDYVTKPFSEEELLVRIDRILSRHRIVSQLQKREAQLTEMALFDALTGLYNRHGMGELMDNRIAHCNKHNTPAVLMMLDLDHFKQINDNFGHPFGDTVLAQVGETLNDVLRNNDIAGRWGGDEFIVLLTRCTENDARQVAERIQRKLEHKSEHIRCSIGMAPLTQGDSLNALMSKADKALYRVKMQGKNGILSYLEISEPAL